MSIKKQYSDFCKPKLAALLSALKLDSHIVAAEGNYLKCDDGKYVLDLVSGFGAAVLGHSHPEIVKAATSALQNNVPVCAQGTIRGASAKLAQKLNALLPGESAPYCINFSNSGTESVEAAIKHAYKVRFEKVLREYERLNRLLNDFYYRVESMPECPKIPGKDKDGKNKDLIAFRDDLDEYNLAQFESFQNNPVIISFKGGYHGKTISSLKVTFNK
ncbi:MAG: aminotransferase class III-fold pyridoxal phosphate-dependent enzyme, partial [Gammaproteobacteria bacterium]|nr:aminotransferase class III-fold pyridoxal phosphate-dependent enzyme [Gammaproteobacteria bacterium]